MTACLMGAFRKTILVRCSLRREHHWLEVLHQCICADVQLVAVVAGLTYHACDLPQPEMTLVPLIVVTTLVEILFFSVRVWTMRKKGHSRGYDDISISIAFVSHCICESAVVRVVCCDDQSD